MKIITENGILGLYLPQNGKYYEDEGTLCIYDPNGVGAISITSYSIPRNYIFLPLKEMVDFVLSIDDKVVFNENELNIHNKYYNYVFFDLKNSFWNIWLFVNGNNAVFATYTCDRNDRYKDKEFVDNVINSLAFRQIH
jgi:hypothetical protein